MSDDEESFHSADEGDGDQKLDAPAVAQVQLSPRRSSAILQLQDEEPDTDDVQPVVTDAAMIREVADGGSSSSWSRPSDLKFKGSTESAKNDTTMDRVSTYVHDTIKMVADTARSAEKEQSAPVSDGWDVDWSQEADDDEFDASEMVTPCTEMPAGKLVLDVDTPQAAAPKSITDKPSASTAGGWGSGWGSILSAASDGLTNLTHTVGEGLTDVMETVHSGLGVPTPEDLAKLSIQEKLELEKKLDEMKEPWPSQDHDDCGSCTDEVCSNSGSDGGVSGVPKRVPTTTTTTEGHTASGNVFSAPPAISGLFSGVTASGKSLVTGAFDGLELLGKKTYDVLTVSDEEAGGRRRFIFAESSTNLSQVLRDRKQRAEEDARNEQAQADAKLASYTYHFEKLEGLVQLEGLEMVSANCVRQLSDSSTDCDMLRDQLAAVTDIFAEYLDSADSYSEELDHDFEEAIGRCIERLALPYNCTKLIATQGARRYYIENVVSRQHDGIHAGSLDVFHKAIESMADLTARSVEALHKMSQLLLISYSPKLEPRALVDLVDVLCNEVGIISCRFSDAYNAACTNESLDTDIVGEKITSLFLEANNSCNYIRECLRLLQPVLQFAIVDTLRRSAA